MPCLKGLHLNPGYCGLRRDRRGPFPLDRGKTRLALNHAKREKTRSDSSRRIATLSTFSIFPLRLVSLTHPSIPTSFCLLRSPLGILIFPCLHPLASSVVHSFIPTQSVIYSLSTTTSPVKRAQSTITTLTTMKVFSSTCNFEYSWDEVSTANWRKYCPWNDKATHVVGVDTLSRTIDPKTGIVSPILRKDSY